MTAARARRRLGRLTINVAGAAVFLVSIFPFFWMVSTALKPSQEIFSTTPQPFPRHPTLEHFDAILGGAIAGIPFWTYFRNSALVALATVVAAAALAFLAAVAVARFRFRLRASFLVLLLGVQMIPLEALVIPLFLSAARLQLVGSLVGLVVVYVGFALPFSVWMLRGFVAAVPRELEDAAAIDGAGPIRTMWRILLPLVAPGLVATSIFAFITAWNEFLLAFTFLQNEQAKYTLPIALQYFFGRNENEWGAVMAASTLLTVPVVVFFLAVQRRMVSGLVSGAVNR